ncbi:MAG: FtsX-like permease family protein [Bacteroidales bacterium]|nr:FtsX-like permease family protein [Bacteroidales bacterium]
MKTGRFRSAFFIAWRHFFSKKKHGIVNIISVISMVGVLSGTAALVIVLSVFNGMEDVVVNSFNDFNPDFKITAVQGKSFGVDTFPADRLRALKGVKAVEEVVSDLVLIEYGESQHLIELKGVSENYIAAGGFDKMLIDGSFQFHTEEPQVDEYLNAVYEPGDCGVMGSRAAGTLRLNLNSQETIKLYYPQRQSRALAREKDLTKKYLIPGGVFESQTEYDARYLFCSIDFARSLMSYEGAMTSVEVFLDPSAHMDQLQPEIEKIVGKQYHVKNRFQQEELLFKTVHSEKLVIFIILAFILFIAIFNIVGTLAMIIIEKKEEIVVLRYLGADSSLIRGIFVLEGMFISFVGGVLGMVLGGVVCLLQQTFHWVKIGDGTGSYVIDYYPVRMDAMDFLIVFVLIFVISLLASAIPAGRVRDTSKL